MEGLVYSALSVSALCFLMALGSLPMASREPRPRSSIAYGLGFLSVAVGTLALAVRHGVHYGAFLVLFQNVLLMSGLAAIWMGTWMRCGQPVPFAALLTLLGASIAAFLPFLFLYDLPIARFLIVGAYTSAGSVMAAWCVFRKKPARNFADQFLIGMFLFGAANELCVIALTLVTAADSRQIWTLYGVSMPVFFVGIGIFVFQSYALDSLADLNRRSETDPLTGLLNRRGFDERLTQTLANARRYKRPLSLMMADLDHFKRINDTYGHSTGDELLKAFADMLARNSRESDVVARIGGEEFAIIMQEIDGEQARGYAERLRADTARQVRVREDAMTGSFGVAEAVDVAFNAKSLVDAADTALYRAKDRGRDRVEVYSAGEPVRRDVGLPA